MPFWKAAHVHRQYFVKFSVKKLLPTKWYSWPAWRKLGKDSPAGRKLNWGGWRKKVREAVEVLPWEVDEKLLLVSLKTLLIQEVSEYKALIIFALIEKTKNKKNNSKNIFREEDEEEEEKLWESAMAAFLLFAVVRVSTVNNEIDCSHYWASLGHMREAQCSEPIIFFVEPGPLEACLRSENNRPTQTKTPILSESSIYVFIFLKGNPIISS